jgi:hypothetical protein
MDNKSQLGKHQMELPSDSRCKKYRWYKQLEMQILPGSRTPECKTLRLNCQEELPMLPQLSSKSHQSTAQRDKRVQKWRSNDLEGKKCTG